MAAEHAENVTLVVCANAGGNVIPPMVIYKGKRLKPEYGCNLRPVPFVYLSTKKALSIANITNGFRATGIYPFDSTAIPDSAFAPSLMTFEEENALHPPIVEQEADVGLFATTHHPTTSAYHIDYEAGTAPISNATIPFSDEVGVPTSASSKDDTM